MPHLSWAALHNYILFSYSVEHDAVKGGHSLDNGLDVSYKTAILYV